MLKKNKIQCIDLLKKGPFFYEYLALILTNTNSKKKYCLRAMAKKSIISNKIDEEMVINELYIRSHIRHPFLINQIIAFQDYDTLFYITEYAPVYLMKSSIFQERLDMKTIKFYVAEIFIALQYLHSKNLIYTFLSPDNIKIGLDGHIKLDYAFCNSLEEDKTKISRYIEYSSVDYVLYNEFTKLNDFWSLGIVMFKMATGYTPFEGDGFESTVDKMITKNLEFPYFIKDQDFIHLVSLLLNKDKKTREAVVSNDAEIIKNHPFFTSIDWEVFNQKKTVAPYIPNIEESNFSKSPYLNMLYTSDFIVGDRDGYGNTFLDYNTVNYFDK